MKNMFDENKNYKTMSGLPFRFIGKSLDKDYPIIGEVMRCGDEWALERYTEDGKYRFGDSPSPMDLVEAPIRFEQEFWFKEGWAVVSIKNLDSGDMIPRGYKKKTFTLTEK